MMKSIEIPDVKTYIHLHREIDMLFLNDTIDLFQIVGSVVALANSNGGSLIIGVGKNHKVVGVNPQDAKLIQEFIIENCSPAIAIQVSILQIRHQFIFRVDVEQSNEIVSFKNSDEKWLRSIVVDLSVFVVNEVLDEYLKIKTNLETNIIQSQDCCDAIIRELSVHGTSSFSRITSVLDYKRGMLSYHLAYLIYNKQVKFEIVDAKVNYFIA